MLDIVLHFIAGWQIGGWLTCWLNKATKRKS